MRSSAHAELARPRPRFCSLNLRNPRRAALMSWYSRTMMMRISTGSVATVFGVSATAGAGATGSSSAVTHRAGQCRGRAQHQSHPTPPRSPRSTSLSQLHDTLQSLRSDVHRLHAGKRRDRLQGTLQLQYLEQDSRVGAGSQPNAPTTSSSQQRSTSRADRRAASQTRG